MSDAPKCLACKATALERRPEPLPGIALYTCPACDRTYAQHPGGPVYQRWTGALALVLYSVIFDARPQDRAVEQARYWMRERSQDVEPIYWEIRLELAQPTRLVRDVHRCIASEDDLREYLRLMAEEFESAIERLR